MEGTLISVIVPVYNVEKYIRQCVDSLLMQTYSNLEIILVDDGSTDSSGTMCDEYEKKDKRIKVIHKKNEGLGFARNSGMEVACGDYVIFIDSDDYASLDLVECLYRAVIENNADTAIGGYKRVNDQGKIEYVCPMDEVIIFENEKVLQKFLPRLLGSSPENQDSIRMSVWNAIYSLNIIRQYNIKFPSERVMISEDIIFDLYYYQFSRKVVTIKDCCYFYRNVDGSLTTKYRSERFGLCKKLYKEELRIIESIGGTQETKYRIMRYFFILLRKCIGQEYKKVSGLSVSHSVKNIKAICTDKEVREVIKQYPVSSLGLKQKLFINMIKYKMSFLLYCSSNYLK